MVPQSIKNLRERRQFYITTANICGIDEFSWMFLTWYNTNKDKVNKKKRWTCAPFVYMDKDFAEWFQIFNNPLDKTYLQYPYMA